MKFGESAYQRQQAPEAKHRQLSCWYSGGTRCRNRNGQHLATNEVEYLNLAVRKKRSGRLPECRSANTFQLARSEPSQLQVALRTARQQMRPMNRASRHQSQIPMCFNEPRELYAFRAKRRLLKFKFKCWKGMAEQAEPAPRFVVDTRICNCL